MFEKLFYNAEIAGKDHRQTAMLVRGQEIIAVGSREYCLTKAGNEIQQIDCEGSTIVPGFTDSHCHLVETGDALLQPDLKGRSMADLIVIIQKTCSTESSELPAIVMGIDDYQFNELKLQSKNPFASNNGILLFHTSGHCAIADRNASRFLHRTPNGEGPVVIDEPYEDSQILMILQKRKQHDIHMAKSIHKAVEYYQSCGTTSVQDNTWDPEVYRYLSQMIRGIDITSWAKGEDPESVSSITHGSAASENISTGPLKFFLDGAFYNKTAWLSEPYNNTENWYGQGLPSADIIKRIEPFIAHKKQCIFHAEGDRAISELCTALENLLPLYPWIPELRTRIEHAQLINDTDYERIRNLGMVISVQPGACSNPERDISILGEGRANEAYPHKKIIEEGIPLAFGSDFPYEEIIDPFEGLNMVTRRTLGESLELEEALKVYTEGSAYADFSENRKGSIEPGFQADFFITSENPAIEINTGKDAIEEVYSRGLCVYKKEG
jgi:predicted amidohydrolase YtcJ